MQTKSSTQQFIAHKKYSLHSSYTVKLGVKTLRLLLIEAGSLFTDPSEFLASYTQSLLP